MNLAEALRRGQVCYQIMASGKRHLLVRGVGCPTLEPSVAALIHKGQVVELDRVGSKIPLRLLWG